MNSSHPRPAHAAEGLASVSVALLGSGGAGVLTSGQLLLEAACRAGWNGLLTRSVGPQIRGGEAAALVRLSGQPVECHGGGFDLLLAIDWQNAGRFDSEIAMNPGALVVADPLGGEAPASMVSPGTRRCELPCTELCRAHPQWRANMIVLGAAARLLAIPSDILERVIADRFESKGEATTAANLAAAQAGAAAVGALALTRSLPAPSVTSGKRWLITGNEAVGLGAIRGGIRFAAAYPITPASEILEWLAPKLARVGGSLVQAEDELASVNMILGASYGGIPSLTATSGPGFSLMVESIGLAAAAEVPIVVVNVMRAGPSTGIPTKSEQADLNIAVYGLHGDAPHLVIAPQSVPDCLLSTQWAASLAEALQTPAIVLSDQFLGQAQAAIARPTEIAFLGKRLRAEPAGGVYRRYALAANGVSPMAIPGTPGGQYVADGLTHTERGVPTSTAHDHVAQLEKRRDKLERHEYGQLWATLEGDGETALLTWGSLTGVAREALRLAADRGLRACLIAPRLLAPARPAAMRAALRGVRRAVVVEQSHGAQFHKYLRAHYDLPPDTQVLHRPGPLTIRPAEICDALFAGSAT